ncbi:MAG: UbiD family decarboxylase, partial [Planctomycetota bacterium]
MACSGLDRLGLRADPRVQRALFRRDQKNLAPNAPSDSARRNDPRFAGLGGPAILCENVEGSDIPLLINAYGSYRRMEIALGCSPGGFDAIGDRIGELVKPEPPRSLSDAIAKAKQFAPLLKIGPKRTRGPGRCQEVVLRGDEIDLARLPIIRCWPHDGDFAAVGYPAGVNDAVPGLGHPGIDAATWNEHYRGRYITLAGIHTIHADDAGERKPSSHNIGMYRVQLLGKDRVAMHWHMHHDGASHWRSWKKRGEPMPVAIALGGPSVLPYAATAPLPPGISELLMAGFLQGGGLRLCRGASVPLWVPADAEIVIEGFVNPDAGAIGYDPRTDGPLGEGAVFEGPFGDHTGFYSMPDRYPIVEVTAVTMRRKPIYPTTVVGLPPQEDYYLGKATERVFFPLLKTLIHDIEDYDLPMFGAFHNCAFITIGKAYPLQARRVMHAVWGAGQMAWTKTIFVVDSDVDVHDTLAVLRAASEHCDPSQDIELVRGPLDILDHAAPFLGGGGKLGFDCTKKWPGEEPGSAGTPTEPRVFEDREACAADARSVDGVTDAAMPAESGGWLFVSTEASTGEAVDELADRVLEAAGGRAAFVVLVGAGVDVRSPDEAMFHWVANADMLRDARVVGRTMWFDATPKPEGADEGERRGMPVRPWPPLLSMDAAVAERVGSRFGDRFTPPPPA